MAKFTVNSKPINRPQKQNKPMELIGKLELMNKEVRALKRKIRALKFVVFAITLLLIIDHFMI